MSRGGKICWKAIRARARDRVSGAAVTTEDLDGGERLAALYRFQNGERTADLCFFHDGHDGEPREAEVRHPTEVDWDGFPVLAALEAVTRDELRRLRRLLRADSATFGTLGSAITDEPTPPGSAGQGSPWGMGLGPTFRF